MGSSGVKHVAEAVLIGDKPASCFNSVMLAQLRGVND
jgi:hypothetical protein